MKAIVITIGDELLIGQVIDSNAAFIGRQLTQIGVDVVQIKTIPDADHEILKALKEASEGFDLVVVTGGLGPTHDDLTKRCFCTYFEDELIENKSVLDHIKELFTSIEEPLLPVHLDQALVPGRARILNNKYGTAPGMWIENEGVVYVALPGVPYEMKPILTDELIPKLKDRFDRPYILQKTILCYGAGESRIAKKIETWEADLPSSMKLAYLPQPGKVRLRVMIRGANRKKIAEVLHDRLRGLEKMLGDFFGGYEGEHNIEEDIADRLTQHKLTLATAESCTGGKIAALFTGIPGASVYYRGGLVPYQTAMKTRILGVSKAVIREFSVVSREVAEAMALQAQKLFQVDVAVATTGNAGPTKGDSDAAVGTVFIAIALKNKMEVREYHLGKLREKVVEKAVYEALVMLHRMLLKEGQEG